MGGWVDGWMEEKTGLWIAYSNKKYYSKLPNSVHIINIRLELQGGHSGAKLQMLCNEYFRG